MLKKMDSNICTHIFLFEVSFNQFTIKSALEKKLRKTRKMNFDLDKIVDEVLNISRKKRIGFRK